MAWSNGYTYRRAIVVDNTKVSGTGDLTDFPVLVKGTYSYLATIANGGGVKNASGFDVVFASDVDGATPLKHEIERYNAATGEVIYWVKVPTLDGDADTTIYIFYGNAAISTDQSDKNNVWRSEYKTVNHLQQIGDGTGNEYIDSTVNANHGTGGVGTTNVPDRVDGKIGYAQQFDDATTDGIDIADAASLDLAVDTDATFSLWIKESGSGSTIWEVLFSKRSTGTVCNYQAFLWENSQDISWQNDGNASRGTGAITTTAKKLTFVVDSTANTVTVYINGGVQDTFTSREIGTVNNAALTLGYWTDGTPKEFLSADIEEFRVYVGKLTTDWILTEYNNENSPSTFYAVGNESESGIAFDAASNSGYQATASTYNWAHTTSGNNRYLVVGVSLLSVIGSSVTGITYNSVAMTFLGAVASVSGAVRAELWGLIAPSTGSNSIEVTLSTGLISAACAVSFTGVNQSVPTEGLNTATATNVGAADATVDVTTVATNDWIIDQVATDDTAITVGAGQTSRNNVTGAGGSGADSTEPDTAPSTVTMSWANVAALATWSIAAIASRDANASSGITSGFMTTNKFMS